MHFVSLRSASPKLRNALRRVVPLDLAIANLIRCSGALKPGVTKCTGAQHTPRSANTAIHCVSGPLKVGHALTEHIGLPPSAFTWPNHLARRAASLQATDAEPTEARPPGPSRRSCGIGPSRDPRARAALKADRNPMLGTALAAAHPFACCRLSLPNVGWDRAGAERVRGTGHGQRRVTPGKLT
jgi:hypothetical protein